MPCEIWEDDPAMVAAIEDRFDLVDATNWPKRRDNEKAEKWQAHK